METSYKNISYFFMGILLCVLVGFHQTYTVKFPTFEGLTTVHHFHGAMLMAWFGMLIVQPLFIKYQKREWHRQLGKVSYVLLPLVLYSIFLVTKTQYLRTISQMPKEVVIGGLALDIPNIVVFGAFYVLAMVYRHRSDYHMRYMIGTSLLMIGPGIGRAMIIYGNIPFPVAIVYTMYFTELIAVIFLILDYIKGQSIKPFGVILGCVVALHLIWNYQMSGWWQAFGGWFANVFF